MRVLYLIVAVAYLTPVYGPIFVNEASLWLLIMVWLCDALSKVVHNTFGHGVATSLYDLPFSEVGITLIYSIIQIPDFDRIKSSRVRRNIILFGPLSNLAMAGLGFLGLYAIGEHSIEYFFQFLSGRAVEGSPLVFSAEVFLFYFSYLNLYRFGFDLIPVFGSDGERLLRIRGENKEGSPLKRIRGASLLLGIAIPLLWIVYVVVSQKSPFDVSPLWFIFSLGIGIALLFYSGGDIRNPDSKSGLLYIKLWAWSFYVMGGSGQLNREDFLA